MRTPIETCAHDAIERRYTMGGRRFVHCGECRGDFSEATINRQHLERVTGRTKRAILEFCAGSVGRVWRMGELLEFIEGQGVPVAPGSPSRVLRELRQEGRIRYEVVNRRRSEYEVEAVTL